MQYIFDIQEAEKYGLEESIILYNIKFWLIKNYANQKNIHDGNVWTYNSIEAFKKLFPFWTEHQIRRILKSLIDQEVLITGNYNKMAYDRTLWYALKDKSICENGQMEMTEASNRIVQTVEPIPDVNQIEKPDVITYNEDVIFLTNYFYDKMLKPTKYLNKKPDLTKWYKPIHDLNNIDGIEFQLIEKVIDFAVTDKFWKTNIQSTTKLREKFNYLELKMRETGQQKKLTYEENLKRYQEMEGEL